MLDVERILKSSHLPTLPAVAVRLLDFSKSGSGEPEELVEIIRVDPAQLTNPEIYSIWLNRLFIDIRYVIFAVNNHYRCLPLAVSGSTPLAVSGSTPFK